MDFRLARSMSMIAGVIAPAQSRPWAVMAYSAAAARAA